MKSSYDRYAQIFGVAPATHGAAGWQMNATAFTQIDDWGMAYASDGRGMPPEYPPLAGNPSIQMQTAVNPIRMVLNGGFPPGTSGNPEPFGMPPFAQTLSDDEVAAVVTYIRAAWGNRGAAVSSREANQLRTAPVE